MSALPRVSVILIDGGFREHVRSVDTLCGQASGSAGVEIVWVEAGGRVNPAVVKLLEGSAAGQVVKLGSRGVYHASKCFNAGLRAARGELIVVADADLVFDETFLATVLRDHARDRRLVEYFHRADEPEPEPAAASRAACLPRLREVAEVRVPSNWGACLTVRKEWLVHINGYDEHPIFSTGEHCLAYDAYVRLRNLGLPIRWHPSHLVYHPWHPGTAKYTDRSRRQAVVSNWHATQRSHLPFKGMDSSLDRPMPPRLRARLRAPVGLPENPEKSA